MNGIISVRDFQSSYESSQPPEEVEFKEMDIELDFIVTKFGNWVCRAHGALQEEDFDVFQKRMFQIAAESGVQLIELKKAGSSTEVFRNEVRNTVEKIDTYAKQFLENNRSYDQKKETVANNIDGVAKSIKKASLDFNEIVLTSDFKSSANHLHPAIQETADLLLEGMAAVRLASTIYDLYHAQSNAVLAAKSQAVDWACKSSPQMQTACKEVEIKVRKIADQLVPEAIYSAFERFTMQLEQKTEFIEATYGIPKEVTLKSFEDIGMLTIKKIEQ